ncbi:NAD(P)H-dependent oxidoreductase [Wenyingzhuangia sp. chi5]|uniref:NAD(P)H-dependent oxidoreductase n=1 Tax=Wenyingzhuangia gilva TaxID=3057677 RepID=A0ABT8VTD0_9FLAO|nr:NAD(P)H-dependent oxidoreductase [Wenyingzhuangia sp. chi5]MDO3695239.1 NAD(P)H-dependent oxidoreductase [Wenyingzhuangia sp. chi5]
MKNVIVFGASNSKNSINQQLAEYAASKLSDAKITTIDLNDYEMPIYSLDREGASGIPQLAKDFDAMMATADGFIVSFAEYNGVYSTAFKNIFDWVSRVDGNVWKDKPVIFMATSPGERGGITVLEIAAGRMPYHGAMVVGTFSLASFGDNFKDGAIVNDDLNKELTKLVNKFHKELLEA